MKKILSSFLSLLLCTVLSNAQPIAVEQAEQSAAAFLSNVKNTAQTRSGRNASTPKLELAYTTNQFYVFNDRDGGFVIAGADESAKTILAYSTHGSFDYDKANPNMKYWLDLYQQQIASASEYNVTAGTSDLDTTRINVPAMIMTHWGQEKPYNNAIYAETGIRHMTGCVCTALSQIMKYHEWPVHGYGSHTYYDDESETEYTRDFSAHTYAWADMINEYEYNAYTDAQANAVAELMFDVSVSINMNFSKDGSGSWDELVPYALANFFGYDEGVRYVRRLFYTDEEWEEMVYREMEAGRPVLYGGESPDGKSGHAFICDGYDASNGLFHFNWGWNGDSDCFCTLDATPKGSGNKFSKNQDMIMGIQKPCGGQTEPEILIARYSSLIVDRTDSVCFAHFTSGGFLWNSSHKAADVLFALKYTDCTTGETYYADCKDDTVHFGELFVKGEYFAPDIREYLDARDTLYFKNVAVHEGRQKISLVYRNAADSTSDWKEVKSRTDRKNYVMVNDTVNITLTNLSVSDSIGYVDFTALNSTYAVHFKIVSPTPVGTFTEEDCNTDECYLIMDDRIILIQKADITVVEDKDSYILSATVTGSDWNTYIIRLSYVAKERKESVVITNAEFYDYRNMDGSIQVMGWNADRNVMLSITAYIDDLDCEIGKYDFDGSYTFVMEVDEGDTVYYDFVDGKATMTSDSEIFTVTGTIQFRSGHEGTPNPQYTFTMTGELPVYIALNNLSLTDWGGSEVNYSASDSVYEVQLCVETELAIGNFQNFTDDSYIIVGTDTVFIFGGNIYVNQEGSRYNIKGFVFGYDGMIYTLYLTSARPEKTRSESIEFTYAEFYDDRDFGGSIQMVGTNSDNTVELSVCIFTDYLNCIAGSDDFLDTYTYLYIEENGVEKNYNLVYGDITVSEDNGRITITGTILFENVDDSNDRPEYTFSMTAVLTGISETQDGTEGEKFWINDRIYIQDGRKFLARP